MQKTIVLALTVLTLSACSAGSTSTKTTETTTTQDPGPNPTKPEPSGGLVDTEWIGDGTSGERYVFHFKKTKLEAKVVCAPATNQSALKLTTPITYSEDATVATLGSTIDMNLPGGDQGCSVRLPQDLEFHLDGSTIFLIYRGIRQDTQLKRTN